MNLFRNGNSKKAVRLSPSDSSLALRLFGFPLLILDSEAIVKAANQSACELTKLTDEQIQGQSLDTIPPRDMWSRVAEQVRLMRHLPSPVVCEGTDDVSGSIWEFTLTLLDEKSLDGQVLLMARDITGQKSVEQTLQSHREYLSALQETTVGLLNRLDMEAQLDTIIARVCTLLRVQYGYLFLVEPSGAEMRLKVSNGLFGEPIGSSIRPNQGLPGKVWQTGQPLAVDKAHCWPHRLGDDGNSYFQSALALPIESDSFIIGVLGVATTEAGRHFNAEEIESLNRFAQLASIILDNAQMFKSLQRGLLERTRAEEARLESIEKYKLLFQSNPLPLMVYDKDTFSFLAVNDAATRHYGYSQEEFLNMRFDHLREKGNTSALLLRLAQSLPELTGGGAWKHRKKVGTVIDVEVTSHEILFEGKPAILALVNDVTERKRAEDVLQRKEEHYRSLIENASDLIIILNGHGTVSYISPSIERALGYSTQDLICRNIFEFVHPEDFSTAFSAITNSIEFPGESRIIEMRMRHKEGQWRLYESIGKCVFDETGNPSVIINARDTTDRKAAEEQLTHNALHDPLTDLPNRRLFMDRLEHAINQCKQRPGYLYAVLFLDFDHFKLVNDSLGHLIGDRLLVAISRRIVSILRPEDTIARLGGDEFAILIEDIEAPDIAVQIAERVQQLMAAPFQLNGQTIYTSVSIGIAFGAPEYEKSEEIIRDADTAMYRAKAGGRSCHAVFDNAMHGQAVKQLQFRNDLRRALDQNQFVLYYQPIVRLDTDQIVGFEALVRWQHPEYGLIPPVEFIPVAEEMNLINELGEWVLREACRQTREWHMGQPGSSPLSISVNLSVKQLAQPGLVEQVEQILREYELDPQMLKLEITESLFMQEPECMALVLSRLKQLGVKLHIDDFGTGYSSLSYLHKFPVDCLKVDRSFITDLTTNPKNAQIVRTIVILAHNLGMTVIAEGIETAEHLSELRSLDCEHAQGYFFSRPVESTLAEDMLRSQQQRYRNAALMPATIDCHSESIN
jgi:diguanylate cyclase (GGDEF)-like protein/PAS domain S-box-containing protein